MSGFTDHNIKHSSISQINKWIAAPDAWVSHYLFGNRGSASSAMWRGIFSEQAVSDTITETLLIDDAIERAVKDFDDKIMFDDDGSEDGQHKVNMKATGDGWELNFIGFLDFKFPNHGLIVDLKTTLRMPSIMSTGHQRQRGFYAKASGNAAVKFLYVTPKKFDMKEDGDPDELMAEIKLHLTRQERFLRLGDKDLLRDIVPVSPDSFYWRGDEAVRQRLYGI